jgi:hypothetical protein
MHGFWGLCSQVCLLLLLPASPVMGVSRLLRSQAAGGAAARAPAARLALKSASHCSRARLNTSWLCCSAWRTAAMPECCTR